MKSLPLHVAASLSAQSRPSLAAQRVLKHSCCSDKNSHPLGCSSALQLEKHTLLFHLARAAREYPLGCLWSQEGLLPCRGWTRQLTAFPQHQELWEELTTASRKLSWELKGYTKHLSAQVQTLSTILPALQERRNHSCTHHSHLGITHIWQQRRGVQQLSAQHRVHYFSILPLMSHCPASQQRNLQAPAQIP